MKFLAISGSGRNASTNTALLNAVSDIARPRHEVVVYSGVAELPVFSSDAEAVRLPQKVQDFANMVDRSDGLIFSSPEYVRAVPGGLKNAIDWLVSREEFIGKPIALMHASHRGDAVLAQLRLILSTVSDRFMLEPFLVFDLIKLSPDEIWQKLTTTENRAKVDDFLKEFEDRCA